MAKRGSQSFEKRRLEKNRQERQAAKREKREAGKEPGDGDADAPDEATLNERFRLLSERRAAGEVDELTYEKARHKIFVALGLEDPDDDLDDD